MHSPFFPCQVCSLEVQRGWLNWFWRFTRSRISCNYNNEIGANIVCLLASRRTGYNYSPQEERYSKDDLSGNVKTHYRGRRYKPTTLSSNSFLSAGIIIHFFRHRLHRYAVKGTKNISHTNKTHFRTKRHINKMELLSCGNNTKGSKDMLSRFLPHILEWRNLLRVTCSS